MVFSKDFLYEFQVVFFYLGFFRQSMKQIVQTIYSLGSVVGKVYFFFMERKCYFLMFCFVFMYVIFYDVKELMIFVRQIYFIVIFFCVKDVFRNAFLLFREGFSNFDFVWVGNEFVYY